MAGRSRRGIRMLGSVGVHCSIAVLLILLSIAGVVPEPLVSPTRHHDARHAPRDESRAGPGTTVRVSAARGDAVVPAAGRAVVITYRMRAVTGRVVPATGLMLLPRSAPPGDGWPFVVYNHVTTGAADTCAPSRVRERSEARELMTRGDAIATRLLDAGVAVLRPDFEGIGAPGPHPYLIGRSLARSVIDLVTAARRTEPRLGRDWVVAGHSEGGVGALWTADVGQRLPAGTRLHGAVAFTPVTRTADELELLRHVPTAAAGAGGLSAIASLIIGGAATVDPVLRRSLRHGGLSAEAVRVLPHLETRCLPGLGRADSWGGIAPADIPGPDGDRFIARLQAVMRANDPAAVELRPGLPIRIDAGILDAVAPLPFTELLVAGYRGQGSAVTYSRWLGGHPEVVKEGYAAGPAVAWMLDQLRAKVPARVMSRAR